MTSIVDKRLWYFAQAHCQFPSTYANNVQVMKACSAFAQAGQSVTLIVPRRLDTSRRLKAIQGSLWEMYAVTRNFDINWCRFPYPFYRLQQSLYALIASNYALRQHVRMAYTRSDWLAVVFSGLGIPVALELHDYEPSPVLQLALRATRRGRFIALVCISQSLANRMMDYGYAEDMVVVAHDGVDLERFEPRLDKTLARVTLGLPQNAPIVCHVGHLYAGRGVETLLASAARLPDVIFVLVGGNLSDIERYRSQAGYQGLANIQFVGQVSNAQIPKYLYAADVLAMPYTTGTPTHCYMSPMKLFEYLAAGRPIVASDFPVLREVLVNEENALLVAPASVDAFVEAIRRILTDEALTMKLSACGLQTARQYTWFARQQKILAFMGKRLDEMGFRSNL